MGSLFSGSGGFELAGSIFGIRPIWASEIEPFPILVTTKNFPEMKHLGDINKLNGADLEPVTIIAGGSPCQDMSIAGKREGLDGSRSNLFREQIRIIKEMRESDRAAGRTGTQIRPRYMVWENVPGVLSAERGRAFRSLLEAVAELWPDGGVHGECWTLSSSVWPNDANVCSLSSTLETGDVPPRYFLSAKACAGIISRAERRGKALPEELLAALETQIQALET